MPVLKNPRHELFAQELASGKPATEAYVLAGYKPNEGNAGRLNRNEQVQSRVAEILRKAAASVEVTEARVIAEIAKIGFANMLDYIVVDTDGYAVVDLSKLTRDQAAAIQEVTVDTYAERDGEDVHQVKKIKFKLGDKKGNLELLGRYLSLWKDRFEHTGKNGGPVELVHTVERVIVDQVADPDR